MGDVTIQKNYINAKRNLLENYNRLPFYKKFAVRNTIKKLKIELQAIDEGQKKDVLQTDSLTSSGSLYIDKNNYATYSNAVMNIYKMYNNETDYGGEILRGLLDVRLSFIAGSGLSILQSKKGSKEKKVITWINEFLKYNKYYGTRFIEDCLISELEGKLLLVLNPKNIDKQVKIRSYCWIDVNYTVEVKDDDNQEIKKVTYKPNEMEETEIASPDKLVFIRIGGTPNKVNFTVPRIANCLTDIENISRTKYDIRKNNHLFGRVTPYFKTENDTEAQKLHNKIQSLAWKIGRAFAGTAQFSLVEPSGNASDALMKEITQLFKLISIQIGIPVQLLAYPELLSNRATSQDMLENINAATIKERTKLEEGITELIQKAMKIANEKGWCEYYIPDCFTVKIDFTTFANLKQIIEVWLPLMLEEVIDIGTFRSMLPGIDPEEVKKLIEAQKEENMKRFENNLANKNINEENNEDTGEEQSTQERTL